MGYTHYWEFKTAPIKIEESGKNGKEKFVSAVKATQECIAKVPKKIKQRVWSWDSDKNESVSKEMTFPFALFGGNGTGKPVFSDKEICFNGDESKGLGHETFLISMDSKGFDFCKTARKPYDVAVCIALICFKHFFGDDFTYHSDGDIKNGEEGWGKAQEITTEYFK